MDRLFLWMCGVNGFLAVALGAFGAHGLRGMLASAEDGARRLEVWNTAAHYHLVHALALGLAAYLVTRSPGPLTTAAGFAFTAGIVIFSGSLYALALTGLRVLGAITPIGGLCFLVGWACVAAAAWRLPG